MLPFQAEPLDKLQARFHLALAPIYDARQLLKEIKKNPLDRPGLKRKHVFDFDNGIRLIASVERDDRPEATDRRPYLHVSFSEASKERVIKTNVRQQLHELTMMLSRGRLNNPQVHQTGKGIVHFFYDGWGIYNKLDDIERWAIENHWLGQARIT